MMQSFICVCPASLLASVCEILLKDYRNRRSGFPDLVLWNEREVAVCPIVSLLSFEDRSDLRGVIRFSI